MRKTSRTKKVQELIPCGCKCGGILFRFDKYGREHNYINGHNNRGKGGFYYDKGYKYILRPDHHFANSKGYVREHRIVFEEYHNCIILPWGAVHHKNRIKDDNRIENLEGMSKRQHKVLHGKESSNLANHIKTRTTVTNQFGVYPIKKKLFIPPNVSIS